MAHLLRKHELLSAHDLDRIQALCSPPRSCCRSSTRRASRCSRSDPAPVVAYVPGTDAVYTRPQYAAETPSHRHGRSTVFLDKRDRSTRSRSTPERLPCLHATASSARLTTEM